MFVGYTLAGSAMIWWIAMHICRHATRTLITVIMLVTLACGDASREPSPATGHPDANALTLDAIYQQLARSLDQPGMLYHARIETVYDDPGTDATTRPILTTERWVDPRQNLVREEVDDGVNHSTTVSTDTGQYTLDAGQISITHPPPCPGATRAAAAVAACPNAGYTTWVFPTPGSVATYEEVSATPIVTIQTEQESDQPDIVVVAVVEQVQYRVGSVTETTRLYLDPDTFLPRALERDRLCCGADEPVRERSTFVHAFVATDSVSGDFFTPAALRDLRPDPVHMLDEAPPAYTLYWLGRQFAGAEALPPLVLWNVERYHQQDWTEGMDQLMLDYTRADDPFPQEPVVRLTQYARQDWDTLAAAGGPDGPCWTRQELALPSGQATLFLGFTWPEAVPPSPDNCPADRPHDRFLAYAYVGDTVVVVDYPSDSLAAIETVVRALEPRT